MVKKNYKNNDINESLYNLSFLYDYFVLFASNSSHKSVCVVEMYMIDTAQLKNPHKGLLLSRLLMSLCTASTAGMKE